MSKLREREDVMSIERWRELAERGTSGDMVYGILRDWKEEVKQLQQWVDDLQSEMYINCVYCGHRYGPQDEVPATMAEALKEHIEICEKHPMMKIRIDNAELASKLLHREKEVEPLRENVRGLFEIIELLKEQIKELQDGKTNDSS
jgi:sugar phosphate isomerase/epimerase